MVCPVSADNLEKVQRVATEMVFELLKEKLTELGLFSLEEDEGGCVGTSNCSPCVKGGYRDTSIHGFQTTNSHSCSKGKFQWDTEGQKFRSSI